MNHVAAGLRRILPAAALLGLGLALLPAALPAASAAAPAAAADNAADYVTVYPGVYTAREQPLVAKYLADNAALAARGPIDVDALVHGRLPKDTPGLGPVIPVTAEWVAYTNGKYDPDNRLRTDADYARKAGYPGLLAYPTFGTHDDTFMVPWPPASRDKLLVGQLNHNVTSYRPIVPGDTLYLVTDSRQVLDLTAPGGSTWRSVGIETRGSVYNQRGEKVNDVVFRVTENLRQYAAGKAPATAGSPWVGPDWKSRPAKKYTDADWARLLGLWRAEQRRGTVPLYWEDVKVGDRPTPTAEGPVEESVSPVAPWGMGQGGSRTLRTQLLDAATRATFERDPVDGIYRPKDRSLLVPPIPAAPQSNEGMRGQQIQVEAGAIRTTDLHRKLGADRAIMINYMGRDYAIRHLGNWMGDAGWLEDIRWGIMGPEALAAVGMKTPVDFRTERFLAHVPGMEKRHLETHAMTGDALVIRSYVYDKYVRDGQYYVELAWWMETLDGQLCEEGGATVRLPSRATAH